MQKNQPTNAKGHSTSSTKSQATHATSQTQSPALGDAITINKKPAQVFDFIANLENFALVMKGITEVKRLGPTTYRWTFGHKKTEGLTWDTEVTQSTNGSLLKFESVKGSPVQQKAILSISPATGGRGTVLQFEITDSLTKNQYREIFDELTDDQPDVSAHTNMRRLKAYLETDEIPTTDGQTTGRDQSAETLKH